MVYPVTREKAVDGLEPLVEALRRARLEAVRAEKARRKADSKEKNSEVHAKEQRAKGEAQSYFINGKSAAVQYMKKLPNLVPTCTQRIFPRQNRTRKPTATSRKHKYSGAAMRRSLPDLWEGMLPGRKAIDQQLLRPPGGIYEALVPAVGVTFSEAGKAPKFSNRSISQYTGRVSKTEFRTMLTEHTESLPSLARTQPFACSFGTVAKLHCRRSAII